MKLSKILKRALSLFIVGLFVFTAFAVIQSGGGQAQASPSGSSSFTFPYQYGTPTVPSDVGAQGIQGPTVPQSDIGLTVPLSDIGPEGHVGPSYITNWESVLAPPNANFTITVRNGTLSSSVASVGALVSLENITLGTIKTAVTNSTGVASINNIKEGRFILSVTLTGTTGYCSLAVLKNTANSMTVYLLPVSDSTVSVSNGPSASDTADIWVTSPPLVTVFNNLREANIELLNASSGNAVLKTAQTMYNGSVEFTNVNTAYSYAAFADVYEQPLTGQYFDMQNITSSSISVSTGINKLNGWPYVVGGLNSAVDTTITGQTFPSYGPWGFGVNTTVKGGTVYVSNAINGASGIWIRFINVTVIMNTSSGPGSSTVIYLQNSVFWSGNSYGISMTAVNNSVDVGAFYHVSLDRGNPYPITSSYSAFTYFVTYNPGSTDVNYSNSVFFNDTTENNGMVINHTYRDVFYNVTGINLSSGSNISFTQFDNSSIGGGWSSTSGHISPENVNFYDDYWGPNQTVNDVLGSGFYDINRGNITHSLFSASTPIGMSFYTADNMSQAGYDYYIGQNITMSNDRFNFSSFPALAPFLYLAANDTVVNSVFNYWIAPSLYEKIDNHQNHLLGRPGVYQGTIMVGSFNKLTNDEFNSTGVTEIGSQSDNNTISHSEYVGLISPYTTDGIAGNNNTFSNNTVGADYVSYKFLNITADYFNSGNVGSYNFAIQTESGINNIFEYNTFYTFAGGEGGISTVLYQDKSTATQVNFKDNIFWNNESFGSSAKLVSPYAEDITLVGASNNLGSANPDILTNNWFMNLNNGTVPLMIENAAAYVDLIGNHYFVNPETQPSLHGVLHLTGYPFQNPYAMYVGNVSHISDSDYTYSFNSTETGSYSGLSGYLWNYTPDVTISKGIPIVSYSNGLAGGPQPNFIWKGYDYSESVEPTYIQVGVNSSKAPSIGLQFQGIAGALYDIEIFNNGSLISSYQESATSLGVLNATYNPATMPLDPIFYVEYVGSGVTPPPVVPPLVPIVPHVLFGIPYLNVIVLFGGIALASEEFFRTQTKGKEKKYSYTGIFVGIMIAGIGLMSVL